MRAGALSVVFLATISGCASSTDDSSADTPPATAGATSEVTAYPLTIHTCGVETTFAAAPKRVVTAKSSTTEMMLALGVGDTIVGTSYQDGPLPSWLSAMPGATSTAVTQPLSEKLAGSEAVLQREPDLVYAGWESNFSVEGMGERSLLESLGVHTVVSPSACKDDEYQPDPLTFADVFAEIELVGRIFNVHDQAEQLVDKQKQQLESVRSDDRGLSALWYSSGSDTPFVGGSKGSAQLIMDTIGVTNIASGIDDTWGPFSWEKVVEADPDVIILVDSAWGNTDKKIGVLESNPATAQLTAVKQGNYIVVPFAATEAGVRTVSAATDLSEQLAQLRVDQ